MNKRTWSCLVLLIAVLCAAVYLIAAAAGNTSLVEGLPILGRLLSIFAGIVSVLVSVYLIRPRLRPEYRHWNRNLAVFASLLVGLAAGPVLFGYIILRFDLPVDLWDIPSAAWLIGYPILWALWYKLFFLPTWGTWRLRGRYPEMVNAARRFKARGEQFNWYFPLIRVQGRPYLVAEYVIRFPSRLATLDEHGEFVTDPQEAEILLRCYKLAFFTLDAQSSLARAMAIDRLRKTQRTLRRLYRAFRLNEEYFRAAGEPLSSLWQRICNSEQDLDTLVQTQLDRKLWLVECAYRLGFNWLTEVSDRQLREVEDGLAQYNRRLLELRPRLEESIRQAEDLFRATPPRLTVADRVLVPKRPRALKEMWDFLAAQGKEAATWQATVTDFIPTEDDWRHWRLCLAKAARSGHLESTWRLPSQPALSRRHIELQARIELPEEAFAFETYMFNLGKSRILVRFQLPRDRLDTFLQQNGLDPLETGCWPFEDERPDWWPLRRQFRGEGARPCAGKTVDVPYQDVRTAIGVDLTDREYATVYLATSQI